MEFPTNGIEDFLPSSNIEIGKKCFLEAQKLKLNNINQSIHLYQLSSFYLLKTIDELSDPLMKVSLQTMVNVAKRSIQILEKNLNVNDLKVNSPIIEDLNETISERPALTGARGKVSGLTKVSRSSQNTEDEISNDLIQLESKLAHIGIMPTTALIKSARVPNTPVFSSKLDGSFLYLSHHPNLNQQNNTNISGNKVQSNNNSNISNINNSNISSSDNNVIMSESNENNENSKGFKKSSPTTITASSSTSSSSSSSSSSNSSSSSLKKGHTTILQPTIPQSKVYGIDSKSSSSFSHDKSQVTGPYGGVGKVNQTNVTETQQTTYLPYWGATTNFLNWATAGTISQPNTLQTSEQKKKQSQKLNESTLSVNWNDKSMLLLPEDNFTKSNNMNMNIKNNNNNNNNNNSNIPSQNIAITPTAITELLNTIRNLKEERDQLELKVESLTRNTEKIDTFKKQMESFKREYQEKITNIKNKLLSNNLSMSGSNLDDTSISKISTQSNLTSDNYNTKVEQNDQNKIEQLERTVQGLLTKLSTLKEENKIKDQMIHHYKKKAKDLKELNQNGSKDQSKEIISPTRQYEQKEQKEQRESQRQSQRKPNSSAPCTATLQTSLKREISNGPPISIPSPYGNHLQHSRHIKASS